MPDKILLISALVGGVVLGALCSLVPPFHTLTHEFTALVTGLAALGSYFISARLSQVEHSAKFYTSILRSGLIATAFSAASVVTLGVANLLFYPCAFENGLTYFAVTWFPAVFFGNTVGAIIGAKGFRVGRQFLTLVTILLLSGIHDSLQLYFGPRIYPIDFLLGDVSQWWQRATMEIPSVHLLGRLYLILFTLTILAWGCWRFSWREGKRSLLSLPVTASVICVITALLWGSNFGIGIGRGNLHRVYKYTQTTGNLVLHYSADPELLHHLDAITRQAQWDYHFITQRWEIEPTKPVHIYLFESGNTMQRYTGTPFAHAGLGEVFIDQPIALTRALRHEMVHALHEVLDPSPLILLNRAMLEGTAMAFEGEYTLSPAAHARQAAALADDALPSLASMFRLGGFQAINEASAYETAGSFLGYLALTHGMDPFARWQQTLSFERAYGKNLSALEEDWKTFLRALHIPPEDRLQGNFLYDNSVNTSYLSLQCPKVGERDTGIASEAARFSAQGRFTDALPLYQELYEEKKELNWARSWAKCALDADDYSAALDIIDTVLHSRDLRSYERTVLLQDKILVLLKQRDWDALYATYDARAALDTGVATSNRMGETCLRDPELRETYAAILFEEDPVANYEHWEKLKQLRPGYGPILFLYALSGVPSARGLEPRVDAYLAAARHTPEIANALAPEMRSLYNEAFAERRYDLVRALCDSMVSNCTDERFRLQGVLGQRRVQFETDPTALGPLPISPGGTNAL